VQLESGCRLIVDGQIDEGVPMYITSSPHGIEADR
jgi:hypothetical protein